MRQSISCTPTHSRMCLPHTEELRNVFVLITSYSDVCASPRFISQFLRCSCWADMCTNIYIYKFKWIIYIYDYIRMFIYLLKMHWRVVADCIFFPLDLLEENWQVQRIVTGSLGYPRKKSVYIFFKLICAYGIRIEGLKSQKVPQGVYSPVILHHPLLYQ